MAQRPARGRRGIRIIHPASIPPTERKKWLGYCSEMIDFNISAFEKAEKWNEFAKWSWFKDSFSAFVK